LIDAVEITTDETSTTCDAAYWDGAACVYEIEKAEFNDYFRVDDTYLKIFKA
jgi:hypothetical protein